MPETCPSCGERQVVFVIANKWRCKACSKYFDWADIKLREKEKERQKGKETEKEKSR